MLYFALKNQGFFPITFYPNTSDHAWWADVRSAVLNLYAQHLQLDKKISNTKVMHKGMEIRAVLQQKRPYNFSFLIFSWQNYSLLYYSIMFYCTFYIQCFVWSFVKVMFGFLSSKVHSTTQLAENALPSEHTGSSQAQLFSNAKHPQDIFKSILPQNNMLTHHPTFLQNWQTLQRKML